MRIMGRDPTAESLTASKSGSSFGGPAVGSLSVTGSVTMEATATSSWWLFLQVPQFTRGAATLCTGGPCRALPSPASHRRPQRPGVRPLGQLKLTSISWCDVVLCHLWPQMVVHIPGEPREMHELVLDRLSIPLMFLNIGYLALLKVRRPACLTWRLPHLTCCCSCCACC